MLFQNTMQCCNSPAELKVALPLGVVVQPLVELPVTAADRHGACGGRSSPIQHQVECGAGSALCIVRRLSEPALRVLAGMRLPARRRSSPQLDRSWRCSVCLAGNAMGSAGRHTRSELHISCLELDAPQPRRPVGCCI